MASFKTRIRQAAGKGGRIILACDHVGSAIGPRTIKSIEKLHPYICAVKLNFHLLLPLGRKEISDINKTAHRYGLLSIADIKLNDIGDTNQVAAENLWRSGFDAVIANPIMGRKSLARLVSCAHKREKGVIALCHMSAPEARMSYELGVTHEKKRSELYRLFLDWAVSCRADGIIAGATYPEIIRYCKTRAGGKLDIYSPGVGTQGGSAGEALLTGSDYLIVGRTILRSKNPVGAARALHSQAAE